MSHKSLREYIDLVNSNKQIIESVTTPRVTWNGSRWVTEAAPGWTGGETGGGAATGRPARVPAGQGATPPAPAAAPVKTRYKTPAEYDAEIARFSKSSDPNLPPNKRYIDTLKAEKAALAGKSGQGATPPAPAAKAQPEAWVKELQTKLNAAGEKLTVDGIMGPATRAAQSRHPEITTQPEAAQAVAADYRSANDAGRNPTAGQESPEAEPAASAAAPIPGVQGGAAPALSGAAPAAPAASASPWANDPAKDAAWKALSPQDQQWLGKADPTDPYILARAPNKGKPAAAPATAPAGQAAASYAPKAPVQESAGYDEVQRIVSLVHYR